MDYRFIQLCLSDACSDEQLKVLRVSFNTRVECVRVGGGIDRPVSALAQCHGVGWNQGSFESSGMLPAWWCLSACPPFSERERESKVAPGRDLYCACYVSLSLFLFFFKMLFIDEILYLHSDYTTVSLRDHTCEPVYNPQSSSLTSSAPMMPHSARSLSVKGNRYVIFL